MWKACQPTRRLMLHSRPSERTPRTRCLWANLIKSMPTTTFGRACLILRCVCFIICVHYQSLRYYGQATKLSVSQVLANTRKSDGLFLLSCFAHTDNVAATTGTTVQGTTFVPLVRLAIPQHWVCNNLRCNLRVGSLDATRSETGSLGGIGFHTVYKMTNKAYTILRHVFSFVRFTDISCCHGRYLSKMWYSVAKTGEIR